MVFDVVGLGALTLDPTALPMHALTQDVLVHFRTVTGSDATAEVHAGNVVRFSSREAEVHASVVPDLLTNIAGWLASEDGVRLSMPFYAKVVAHSEQRGRFLVQFTSTPQEFVTYVESLAAR
jgi:hypothetical protein